MRTNRDRVGANPAIVRSIGLALAMALIAPVGAIVPGPALALPAPSAVEQTDDRWTFTGSWSTYEGSALSGGSHAVGTAGATAALSFVGESLDLVAMTGPKSGVMNVSVDGAAPVAVDLHADATAYQQTVFGTGALTPGLHTVVVTAADASFVSLDAAVVAGAPVRHPADDADRRIVTRGAWARFDAPGLVGGSHLMSSQAGDELAIAFQGTALDLVAMTGPKMGIVTISVDGGTPVEVDLYSAQTRFRQVVHSVSGLTPGQHSVRIVVSGRAGAASAGAAVSIDAVATDGELRQALIRYEETEPKLGWGGALTAYADGSATNARYVTAGPSWGAVNVSFEGSRMDWIAITGPQFGIATVSLDGGPAIDVDLYAASVGYERLAYTTGELAWGTHTVRISWSGRRNEAATERFVTLDAFDIAGRPVQAVQPEAPAVGVPSPFNYPWIRYIVVDKSDLRLYFVEHGMLVRSYPVAVGKPSTPTPNAIWRIGAKYYSSGVYGPRKMRMFRQQGGTFVYTAYNIHGTNVDSSIGTYASHGCIRMHNYDVLEFYPMVPLGTMVVTRE